MASATPMTATAVTIPLSALPKSSPSVCIPRVFSNISWKRVKDVFDALNLGEIERVDMVKKTSEKGDEFKRVFVHFKEWATTPEAQQVREKLLSGSEVKIVYDEPWFWKLSMSNVEKPVRDHQRERESLRERPGDSLGAGALSQRSGAHHLKPKQKIQLQWKKGDALPGSSSSTTTADHAHAHNATTKRENVRKGGAGGARGLRTQTQTQGHTRQHQSGGAGAGGAGARHHQQKRPYGGGRQRDSEVEELRNMVHELKSIITTMGIAPPSHQHQHQHKHQHQKVQIPPPKIDWGGEAVAVQPVATGGWGVPSQIQTGGWATTDVSAYAPYASQEGGNTPNYSPASPVSPAPATPQYESYAEAEAVEAQAVSVESDDAQDDVAQLKIRTPPSPSPSTPTK